MEQARAQCHSDGVDDEMLLVYGGAAERAAVQFLNRNVYLTADELAMAIAEMPAMLTAADAAYEAARTAAEELTGSARCVAYEAAKTAHNAALESARATYAGIVINADILGGMLLILAHLYRNREAVVTGQGAAAVQLPLGAHAMLWPHRVGLGV